MEQGQNVAMSDTVYLHLRDMILSMEIKPGDRIPEAKIAKQFGISRTPIREAIKRLASDGIVNVYPNRFAEVATFSNDRVRETGLVRIALDVLAARLAVFHGSNYDFSIMEQYLEDCQKAAEQNNVAARIRMNCAFHLELSKISKNNELYELQRGLYLKMEFMQACKYCQVETPEEQYRQHKAIMRALYERNEEELVKVIVKHDQRFHMLKDVNIGLFQGISNET